MANISEFKANMLGGGARPNQFRVELGFPSFVGVGAAVGIRSMFLCKAATLPASTVENIAVQYRGRPVNFAGERTFAPWTITVYNDVDFAIRNALEKWSNGIQNLGQTNGLTNPSDYQVDLQVSQLDRNGSVIKSYSFIDAFPIEIGNIQLDYETTNQIETFDVTFQYNYWTTSVATNDGLLGGNIGGITIGTPIGAVTI